MKSLLLIVAVLVAMATEATAQSKTGQPIPMTATNNPVTVTNNLAVTVTTATTAPTGPIMRRLDRRRLGLTPRNIIRTLQAMKAEGVLDDFKIVTGDGQLAVDVSSLAVVVVDRIRSEKPDAWIDWENIDWDAIIAFVERIIELILKFLPLFL